MTALGAQGTLGRARAQLALGVAGVLALLLLLSQAIAHLGTQAGDDPASQVVRSAERAAGAWQPGSPPGVAVALPDVWRRQQPKLTGVQHYRLHLAAPTWAGPSALYLPRVGNRARLWLDGQLLASFGEVAGGQQDYSSRPLRVLVPPSVGGSRAHELVIEVGGTANRFSGLSQVIWGPAEALEPAYQARDTLLLAGAGLAGGGSLLLGVLGLALAAWRRNTLLVFFGLAGLAAGSRALLWMWREPPLPYLGWYTAMDLCFGVWACSIAWFALRAVELRLAPLEWALRGLMAVMVPSTALAAAGWSTVPKETWLDLTLLVAGAITALLLRRAWHRPDAVANALALGAITVVTLSGMDHWNIFFSTAPAAYVRPYFSHHMALLFSVFMAAALAARFDRALRAEDLLRDDLAAQVQAQREQLQALHAREAGRLQAEATATERQRILQDMHDGLGAHLSGLLTLVQRGPLERSHLEQEVAEAIDQLRLSVDSAGAEGLSVTDVVAQLRFRLAPRLHKLGVDADWQLGDLPGELSVAQASHLQKILLEALSNALRHGQARRLTVTTGLHQGQPSLSFADDGPGLPANPTAGNGLRHMRERAAALGAVLAFEQPEGGGTRLRLSWPAA
jgi:signal transduction histidine kinase